MIINAVTHQSPFLMQENGWLGRLELGRQRVHSYSSRNG
jgi:hypothetical protein